MLHLSYHNAERLFMLCWIILLAITMKVPFNFMAFNVFLAAVPIEIGFQIRRFTDKRSLAFWALLLLWLLFYPNAPYVMTDLFHLSWLHPHTAVSGLLRTDPRMWAIFCLMVTSAFAAVLFGTVSLLTVSRLLTLVTTPHHLGMRYVWIILFTICSSVGIYIGRFLRLHSFYLLMTPSWFFKQLLSIFKPQMWSFTLSMTITQLLLALLINLIRKSAHE